MLYVTLNELKANIQLSTHTSTCYSFGNVLRLTLPVAQD